MPGAAASTFARPIVGPPPWQGASLPQAAAALPFRGPYPTAIGGYKGPAPPQGPSPPRHHPPPRPPPQLLPSPPARRLFLQQDNELAEMRQRLQERSDHLGDLKMCTTEFSEDVEDQREQLCFSGIKGRTALLRIKGTNMLMREGLISREVHIDIQSCRNGVIIISVNLSGVELLMWAGPISGVAHKNLQSSSKDVVYQDMVDMLHTPTGSQCPGYYPQWWLLSSVVIILSGSSFRLSVPDILQLQWDPGDTGQLKCTHGHDGMFFSKNGCFLMTTANDGFKLWDIVTLVVDSVVQRPSTQKPPWPPPTQLKLQHRNGNGQRPQPWPSFSCYQFEEHRDYMTVVIVDLVGDNVGGCAGAFESIYSSSNYQLHILAGSRSPGTSMAIYSTLTLEMFADPKGLQNPGRIMMN